jgi:hypothetical protein
MIAFEKNGEDTWNISEHSLIYHGTLGSATEIESAQAVTFPVIAIFPKESLVMLLKSLVCGAAVAASSLALMTLQLSGHGCPCSGIVALCSAAAPADDGANPSDKPSPSGVWVLEGGEMKIDFDKKDVMKLFPHGESDVVVVVCQYTVEKDSVVKAKITELEGDAKEQVEKILPVGLEFSFKWTAKDGTGAVKDVKGEDVDLLKAHLEGDYSQKKS